MTISPWVSVGNPRSRGFRAQTSIFRAGANAAVIVFANHRDMGRGMRGLKSPFFAFVVIMAGSTGAMADGLIATEDASRPQTWAVHAQITFIEQYHPAFHSPYRGANSLDPGSRGDETATAT